MQRILKVFTLMGAILALAFGLASCTVNVDDDPTMYTVTVSSSIEHGKVSVDKSSAEAGAKVKLTATADSGYELDSYSVKDEKSNTITVTEGTFTMPKSNVTVSATFKETAETVNQKAAAAVIAKITAIGTVAYTSESKEKIDEARMAYNALTEAQKALVPEETLNLLTAAETKYAELKAAAEPKNASYTVKHLQQNIADNNYTLKESETKTGTVGQPTDASAKSYDGFTAQGFTQVTVAASGTVVEIKYDRKSYTVTFNTNGGSTVTSQSLRYGATATKPADPTKTATTTTEYTFADWYSDSGLTTPFSFDTAITGDITLYAKWTATAVTPQKTAGSISYTTTSVSKTTAAEAFTNTLNNTGDGTVTYASSKTAVAEVNATTGLVTIKGAGETTITATVADSDNYTYATKTASYTLTVTQASPLNLNLKTGADIYSILAQLCPGSGSSSACTKFARSNKNNDEATLYLDTEGKYIPVWSEGTEVYYYVPDGCTPVMNEDSSGMFAYCSKLTSLDVTGFDTSNVKNMNYMFLSCSGLTSLDVTGFDTSKVENMKGMFSNCSKLTGLDVTGFDTRKVTNMKSMFSGCSALESLDVSKFDTSKVENMSDMFKRCSKLTSLDVDGFNTSKVTNMSSMFLHCSGLTSLDVTGFDTSIVTDMSVMFAGCSGLTSLDVTGFDTSNVTNMEEMFSICSGLTSLDLSNFNTSEVSNMWSMFSDCEGLTTIYASDKFVTTSLPADDDNCKGGCFSSCSKLVGGAGTTYDSSRESADYARIDGGNSAPGYFTLKLIGSKSKPDAVGDIVFSDGSATPYSEDLTLTEDQKAAAIAVIYYAGSTEDVLGAKTLGVGLKNTGADDYLAWCLDSAAAYNRNITAIQCTPGTDAAATAGFTDDLDGSDNWQALCDAVSDEGTSGNYPAWEWVNAYATTAKLTGDYASGWYLPTVAELSMLYCAKITVNSALEKAGGTEIADDRYWSSSQYASDYGAAWDVRFEDGYLDYNDLTNFRLVCPVRAF